MALPTIRSFSAASQTSGNPTPPALPAGTVDGDLVLYVVSSRNSDNTLAAIADWPVIGGDTGRAQWVLARIKTSAWSTLPPVVFGGTNGQRVLRALSIKDLGQTSNFILATSARNVSASAVDAIFPALNLSAHTAEQNVFLLAIADKNKTATSDSADNQVGSPAGWTKPASNYSSAAGTSIHRYHLTQQQSGGAVSINSFTHDLNPDETVSLASCILAFKTITAGPPPGVKVTKVIDTIPAASAESFVNYANPDLTIGAEVTHDERTSPGNYLFVVDGDGTFSYNSGGDSSRQSVYVATKPAGGSLGAYEKFWINNQIPVFLDPDGVEAFGFAASTLITPIDLTTLFGDYEGDVLTFTEAPGTVDTLAGTGLTRSGSSISGTTNATSKRHKITFRATDVCGDYVDGVLWISVDYYPFEQDQALVPDSQEYDTADALLATLQPQWQAAATVTLNARAVTPTLSDVTGFAFTTPTTALFMGGAWADTPWFTPVNLAATFTKAPAIATAIRIVGPVGKNTYGGPDWAGVIPAVAKGIFAGRVPGAPYHVVALTGQIAFLNEAEGTIAGATGGTYSLWTYEAGVWGARTGGSFVQTIGTPNEVAIGIGLGIGINSKIGT